MRQHTLLIAAFLAFASLTSVCAQDQKSDDHALATLQKVMDTFGEAKGITADFNIVLRYNGTGEIISTDNGSIQIKGEKYRFESDEYVRACDGKAIWTLFKEYNELQIVEYDPNDGEISPTWVASLNADDFIVKQPVGTDVLELSPKDKTLSYFKVILKVGKNNVVQSIAVYEKTGTNYTYELSHITIGDVSDGVFEIKPESLGEDVVVTDLRP